jgi:adenosylcobyric acid synthase
MEWRSRSEHLWPTVHGCLGALMESHDVLVIEGAGSPAEINLQSADFVNMRVAEAARAATLLICDIDRGGAFAHLYGTHQLIPEAQRSWIRGFVLNKFRGDQRLLAPGPDILRSLTGVPTLGVLPMWRDHGLPEEDGVFDANPSGSGVSVAVVAYPRISNLDEFAPLRRVPGIALCWARRAQSIAGADVLILPGSKHVAEDLSWLRHTGLDAAIEAHSRAGKPTLAICGGLQMLGHEIADPHGVEGAAVGLGLLPLSTEFHASKRYQRGRYAFSKLTGFWAPLSGCAFEGYEIRHGRTRNAQSDPDAAQLHAVLPDDCGWQRGSTLALYTHGLFESADALRALFGRDVPTLDDTLDGLADFVGEHIGDRTLESLLVWNGAGSGRA